ncbi:Hypothetical predicted protein [Olea europaea subsp. europaea]|uniref:Uncharacterized protein n=1 Tax=Olea europaea subsp. europaea TaxID=158383 RepID=A0A8S0PJU7_OLEEU|nr:Hypothetical predicted protein [Olea europaea subsp. europaea]
MDAHIPYNPQVAQTHQDAYIHVPITSNNPENQDLQPIFESANSWWTKTFSDDGGGTHDIRPPPPQDTTHHGASTEHTGLPQFGIEMAICPETVNMHRNRFDPLSIGIPPRLQSSNCINQHAIEGQMTLDMDLIASIHKPNATILDLTSRNVRLREEDNSLSNSESNVSQHMNQPGETQIQPKKHWVIIQF